MPTTRSKVTETPRMMLQDATSERASLKRELSLHRDGLLSFLDKHEVDIVPLSGGRVIRRTTITSTKRISKKIILSFVEGFVLQYVTPLKIRPDLDLLLGKMKQNFLIMIDTSTHKGEVLSSESPAALRKNRDGAPLRVGDASLLTSDVLSLARSFEALMERLDEMTIQNKRHLGQFKSEPHVGNRANVTNEESCPIDNAPLCGEVKVDMVAQHPVGTIVTTQSAPTSHNASPPKTMAKKILYVTKSTAYSAFDQIVRLLVDRFTPHASWESFKCIISQIVEADFN